MDKSTKDLLVLGAVGYGIYYVLHKIGGLVPSFGSEDPAQTAPIRADAASNLSPWSPQFYKAYTGAKLLLTDAAATSYANNIWQSTSPVYDDFDRVIGVFKKFKTQAQVSQVADKFQQKFAADLLTWLLGSTWPIDRYDADQVNQLRAIVNQLPKYM